LTWDDFSDTRTRDPFLGNVNDFEGYKLFRATDKRMSDAEVITDGFGTKILKKPIFQCDLIDGILGFTNFGLVNGIAYNLGFDSGVVHYFVDNTVQNGRTYYYALVAYDYGAPNIGPGIAPSENTIIIELDENEEVRDFTRNVQVVTPRQKAAGYVPPQIADVADGTPFGAGSSVFPSVLSDNDLKIGHTYKVKFQVNTLARLTGYPSGYRYVDTGLFVYDVTDSNRLVYQETPEKYAFDNIVYNDSLRFWHFKEADFISTDVFDGLALVIGNPINEPVIDPANTGWLVGGSPMQVTVTSQEFRFLPWDYDIIFTSNTAAYTSRMATGTVRGANNGAVPRAQLLLGQSFNFYVVNKLFKDDNGEPLLMDMVVQDMNANGQFDMLADRIMVGATTSSNRWAGTAFVLDFSVATDPALLPKPDDVYRISFLRPFAASDSVTFTVKAAGPLNTAELKSTMNDIKVVPNPYVMTNELEPEVVNQYRNQRRRIMFTHLPAQCTIKIFTVSGVLVDEIQVDNPAPDGITHWNLESKEGLEIASGMYIYHVKAAATGDEKIGKFAIIK
jgi:hypothetical protein